MASHPDLPTFDEGASTLEHLRPLVDWLVTYDQAQRIELAQVTARAERAERQAEQVAEATAAAESARLEAEALRRALVEMEARSRSREEQLLEAIRAYVMDIGSAQEDLLRLARQALGAGPDEPRSIGGSTPASKTAATEEGATEEATDQEAPADRPVAPGVEAGSSATAVPAEVAGPTSPMHQIRSEVERDSPADPTTDEHRLIDMHNRIDMQRLEGQSSRRNLWGRRADRRRLQGTDNATFA